MKLAPKLTLSMSIGILVVHLGAAGYRVYRETKLFHADVGRDATVLGRGLSHAVERAWETGGQAEVLALVRHATDRQAETEVRWIQLPEQLGTLPPESMAIDAVTARASIRTMTPTTVTTQLPSGEALLTYVPVQVELATFGALEIINPLDDERLYIQRSVLTVAGTTLVLVSLCGAVLWVLSAGLIGAPIRALAERARGVARGALEERVELEGSDELRELAIEMNRMCDRLEEESERANQAASERELVVQQLRHFDRLATVGSLASNMAHELGTPINVIEGHAQLIEELGPDERTNDHLRIIEEQCRRMAGIIRQWLDFARRGRELNGQCQAEPVIESTLSMLRPMARASKVTVTLDPGKAVPNAAIGSAHLQQVILNLAVNSIQAMPDGGSLRISTAFDDRPHFSDAGRNGFVRIEVSDSGGGIEQEALDRIFEPFFTTKDPGKGTGLGLPIAGGIVQEYGGWIEVAETSPAGTTFLVFIPARGERG